LAGVTVKRVEVAGSTGHIGVKADVSTKNEFPPKT